MPQHTDKDRPRRRVFKSKESEAAFRAWRRHEILSFAGKILAGIAAVVAYVILSLMVLETANTPIARSKKK